MKRNELVDLSKGILIWLVTLGHVIQFLTIGMGGGEAFFDNWLFSFVYSFHMPAFMMISGYLIFFTSKNRSLGDNIKKKVSSILVPIISWNVLGYISIYLPLHYKEIASISLLLHGFADYATLWFLVSTFINSIAVLVIQKTTSRLQLSPPRCIVVQMLTLTGLFLIGMVMPGFGQYTFMIPFFYIGYLLAQYNCEIFLSEAPLRRVDVIACCVYFALLPFYTKDKYVYVSGVYANSLKQIEIDIYRWIIGIVGTFFLLSCIKKFKGKIATEILIAAGKHTLPMYAIQSLCFTFILYPIGALIGNVVGYSVFIINLIAIAISFVLFLILFWLSSLLEKNKICRILFLGGR